MTLSCVGNDQKFGSLQGYFITQDPKTRECDIILTLQEP